MAPAPQPHGQLATACVTRAQHQARLVGRHDLVQDAGNPARILDRVAPNLFLHSADGREMDVEMAMDVDSHMDMDFGRTRTSAWTWTRTSTST